MINSLDLHLLWSKSHLRFVVYDLDPDNTSSLHLQSTNRYCLVLQVKHSSNNDTLEDSTGTKDEVFCM